MFMFMLIYLYFTTWNINAKCQIKLILRKELQMNREILASFHTLKHPVSNYIQVLIYTIHHYFQNYSVIFKHISTQ